MPGDEANSVLHMPGGQSGHPLSEFYREGHPAWVHGEATPFLPGPAETRTHIAALRRGKMPLWLRQKFTSTQTYVATR